MTVGLLIITHSDIGNPMLHTACTMIDACPLHVAVVEMPMDYDTESIYEQASHALERVDSGDGVLILTDIYGSTPSNIAVRLNTNNKIRIVTGMNLPMLLRVFNYANSSLDDLVQKAISGGQTGIMKYE